MEKSKQLLKGSPSRDNFKQWHKTLSRRFYATDLDLVLVEKTPPRIVAILDYKRRSDRITFAEAIAYNHFVTLEIPVFLVWSEAPFRCFDVQRYVWGNWRPEPPEITSRTILSGASRTELALWEQRLRKEMLQS